MQSAKRDNPQIPSSVVYSTWKAALPSSEEDLLKVRHLAKLNKRTLGFLPDAAFEDRAQAGTLALATKAGRLVGYALYSLPRSHIKLTHVCTDSSVRGAGVGVGLIEYIIERHPDRTGVIAHCRRDYGLEGFWESAGLTPQGDRPGRSIAGHLLTTWWRPLGGPTLFDHLANEGALPRVVLDANIVIDLYASDKVLRESREASRTLLSDWLAAELNIAVSTAVDDELNRTTDPQERRHQKDGAQHLHRLPRVRPKTHDLEDTLRLRLGPDALRRDKSLKDDINHIADAIRGSASYFVTNDTNLTRLTKQFLAEEYDLEVVRPHELVDLFFDREANPVRYVSGVFEQVELIWRFADASETEVIEQEFLNYSGGERGRSFRHTLRTSLANPESVAVELLLDEDGRRMALLCSGVLSNQLEVHLFRVARHHLAESVAFQVARMLRSRAVQSGAHTVRISDVDSPARVQQALLEDGYAFLERAYVAQVVDQVIEIPPTFTSPLEIRGKRREAPSNALATAALERELWPLKVWDGFTQCLVVPIKPHASMDLLGYPAGLFSARTSLGLSRRHVYYRSGRDNPFKQLPARILWYASQNRGAATQRFFALSRVVQSEIFDAEEAHTRHSHLGVYNRTSVFDAADRRGRINVIEFEDTELLPRPISLEQFRRIAEPHGTAAEFQSPRTITHELFKDLMRAAYADTGSER